MPSLGELLQERRQEHQWTLSEIARQTRICEEYLEALEQARYDLLPADVQVRGFLRTYATVLGLDPKEIISLYQQDQGQPELVSIAPLTAPPRAGGCVFPPLWFALIAFVAMSAIGYWSYFGILNPTTPLPTPTLAPPTPTRILPTATPTLQVFISPPTQPPASTTPGPTTFEGLEAVLEINTACWMRVISDGVEIFQGTLAGDTTRTFTATRELNIRMGNAGGVRVILNGEDLGVQGASGQVVTRIWTVEE